jgi:hypothetical protein
MPPPQRFLRSCWAGESLWAYQEGQMGSKMARFAALSGTRSRQDESIEVGGVGSKRPSLGCNGVHVVWCSGLIFWFLPPLRRLLPARNSQRQRAAGFVEVLHPLPVSPLLSKKPRPLIQGIEPLATPLFRGGSCVPGCSRGLASASWVSFFSRLRGNSTSRKRR